MSKGIFTKNKPVITITYPELFLPLLMLVSESLSSSLLLWVLMSLLLLL